MRRIVQSLFSREYRVLEQFSRKSLLLSSNNSKQQATTLIRCQVCGVSLRGFVYGSTACKTHFKRNAERGLMNMKKIFLHDTSVYTGSISSNFICHKTRLVKYSTTIVSLARRFLSRMIVMKFFRSQHVDVHFLQIICSIFKIDIYSIDSFNE